MEIYTIYIKRTFLPLFFFLIFSSSSIIIKMTSLTLISADFQLSSPSTPTSSTTTTSTTDSIDECQITLQDFHLYLTQLNSRPFKTIPPVGVSGLLPLEKLDIPGFDPTQYRLNPTVKQKESLKVNAQRGPKYLLTYLVRRLGYKPPSSNTILEDGNYLMEPVWSTISTTDCGSLWSQPLPAQQPLGILDRLRISLGRPGTTVVRGPPSPTGSLSSVPSLVSRAPSVFSTNSRRLRRQNSIQNKLPRPTSLHLRQIKPTHKYLANMGTIRIRGADKKSSKPTQFELIIDPRFPSSYLDVSAALPNSTTPSTQYKVVATPVYTPESEYNRVRIDIELIPIDAIVEDDGEIYYEDNDTTNIDHTHRIERRRSIQNSIVSSRANYFNSSITYKELTAGTTLINARPQHTFPAPPSSLTRYGSTEFRLFSGGPLQQPPSLPLPQLPTKKQQDKVDAERRAQQLEDDLFKNKWTTASIDIVKPTATTSRTGGVPTPLPYACVLGRDWVTKLYAVAYDQVKVERFSESDMVDYQRV